MPRASSLFCASAFLILLDAGPLVAEEGSEPTDVPERNVPESDAASVSSDVDESAAPPLRHAGGIAYRTGGVGKEERDALLVTTKAYGLKLVFASKKQDDFVAEVVVDIFDAKDNKVMSAQDTGPLFFAELPPGQYRILANFRGQSIERTATVTKGKQTQMSFTW